jgi:LysM repeat protein
MRPQIGLSLVFLVLAALACSLGSGDNDTTSPTPIPTNIAALPTNTSAPTNTPFATSTPQPTTTTCIPRTDWPTITVQTGDTLFGIALQVGSTVDELVRANCLPDANTITVGQLLRVPSVPPPPPATATPNQNCTAQWFFTFDLGMADDRQLCPNPVIQVSAAGEDFEGGRVLWYGPLPGAADSRGTIYAIYNDGSWESFVDTWEPGQPESDPSIVPPAGRYQPIRGIGKVWREHTDVRQKLGWAYEPEVVFAGRFQEPSGFAGIWANRDPYFYLDHGKWGLVLRLYAVNMGPNWWEVAGRY